jgi:hypothetical protein
MFQSDRRYLGLGIARLYLAAEMRHCHSRGCPQQEATRRGRGSQFERHRMSVILSQAQHGRFQRYDVSGTGRARHKQRGQKALLAHMLLLSLLDARAFVGS